MYFYFFFLPAIYTFKAGFHQRRSRSCKRSRESAYDLVKNRIRKLSHKRHGIGDRRIGTFPFLPTPLRTLSLIFRLYVLVNTRLSESVTEAEG